MMDDYSLNKPFVLHYIQRMGFDCRLITRRSFQKERVIKGLFYRGAALVRRKSFTKFINTRVPLSADS